MFQSHKESIDIDRRERAQERAEPKQDIHIILRSVSFLNTWPRAGSDVGPELPSISLIRDLASVARSHASLE